MARPADGASLAGTASGSVDLVQAHKVFPGTPLLVTLRYFREMARVASERGSIAFDAVTEPCMDERIIEQWMTKEAAYGYYPSMVPRQLVIDFFERRGFACKTAFIVPMEPGATECFGFVRRSS